MTSSIKFQIKMEEVKKKHCNLYPCEEKVTEANRLPEQLIVKTNYF